MVDLPDMTPKKWMQDPLYYTEEEGGDWKKFEGPEAGRRVAVVVLPDGNVFDAALGRFREQFDPVKMREIAALFEPLPEGLGEPQPDGGDDDDFNQPKWLWLLFWVLISIALWFAIIMAYWALT